MRKPVNLKFDEADVTAWDAFAERYGLSRTALIEKIVNAFVKTHAADGPYVPGVVAEREPFVGSSMPGHADVPEVGWYRPSSAEAKQGVPVDVALLKAIDGGKKGA